MKAVVFVAIGLVLVSAGCSTNKHKAEKIDTVMEREEAVTGDDKVGVNKEGDLVVQRKVAMNEELRRIQYEVYELEDRVYGNRKYGSRGLYGTLKSCREQLSKKDNGGDGKLRWTEPIERITDKEDEYKIGIDEKNKLVAVSEEYLKDRIERFRGYKTVLMKREDEYTDKNEICQAELDTKKADAKKAASAGTN